MVLLILALGWAAGAFVNYIADVMPRKRTLVRPFCLACGHVQEWTNYILWPRKCRHCGHHRMWRTWMVELTAIGLTTWLWLNPPVELGFLASLIILVYFAIVVVIDIENHLILHPISLAGGVIGLAVGSWQHGLWESLLGAVFGFGLIFVLYLLGALFVRYVIRRRQHNFTEEALGFGDVILGMVLGLFLGWPAILMGLFLAIIFAGVVSLGYLVVSALTRRYRAFSFIPYGPFLIAGATALLFFKEFILMILRR